MIKMHDKNGVFGQSGGGIGIANNLITTQDGFALDARQGKILNDYISQVNADLLKMIQTSGELAGNVDWNNYLDTGMYFVQNATMTAEYHAPVGMYQFGMLWVSASSYRVLHIYFPHHIEVSKNIAMTIRMLSGENNWTSWYGVQGTLLQ